MGVAGMSNLSVASYGSISSLDENLAAQIIDVLVAAIAERGEASLVVSGGSSPIGFFQCLSRFDIAWQRVSIWLADERWVSAQDEQSNQKLVHTHLLQNFAAKARFMPLAGEHFSSGGSAEHTALGLQQTYEHQSAFDLVILFFDVAANTAGSQELVTGLDAASDTHCVAAQAPTAPPQRISMTLARLINARQIYLHVTGQEKVAVLLDAWRNNDPHNQPIASFLHQGSVPVRVFIDQVFQF